MPWAQVITSVRARSAATVILAPLWVVGPAVPSREGREEAVRDGKRLPLTKDFIREQTKKLQ